MLEVWIWDMSAVFTLRTAIFLTVTSAAFASNITLYNSSTTGTPPARAMPLLKRGERSLVKDDYNLIKVKGSNNGAVTVWPDGSINITSTEASKTHHRYGECALLFIDMSECHGFVFTCIGKWSYCTAECLILIV